MPEYQRRRQHFTTLHDGRVVDSGSDEWKLETLARYVLALGSRGKQEQWLVAHEQRSGKPATDLRERMNAIKQARIVSGAKRHPERQEPSIG